jgi:hypothetical protein
MTSRSELQPSQRTARSAGQGFANRDGVFRAVEAHSLSESNHHCYKHVESQARSRLFLCSALCHHATSRKLLALCVSLRDGRRQDGVREPYRARVRRCAARLCQGQHSGGEHDPQPAPRPRQRRFCHAREAVVRGVDAIVKQVWPAPLR